MPSQANEARAVQGTWQDGVARAEADPRPARPWGLTQTIYTSAESVAIPDTAADDRVNPVTRAAGVRALLGVPLRLGEQVLGVLYAYADAPRHFADHEIDLLQIFANQAAVAIANARLFEERRTVERRLESENLRMARELVTARATQQRLLPAMPQTLAACAATASARRRWRSAATISTCCRCPMAGWSSRWAT